MPFDSSFKVRSRRLLFVQVVFSEACSCCPARSSYHCVVFCLHPVPFGFVSLQPCVCGPMGSRFVSAAPNSLIQSTAYSHVLGFVPDPRGDHMQTGVHRGCAEVC